MKRIRAIVSVISLCLLTGCALWRGSGSTPQAQAQAPAPAPAAGSAATPPETPSETQAETPQPEPPPAAASGESTTPPPCVAPEVKPKTKSRPKPKVVRKEAPPQIPTAPAVAATPPGGVVHATVGETPVPVMSILGKRVEGAKGEDFGRVVDVLADATGRVRTAIIDFGGFLGVGDRRIAVEWPLLRFNPDGRDPSLLLSVSREQLRAAPEYKDVPRPRVLSESATPSAQPEAAAAAAAAAVKK